MVKNLSCSAGDTGLIPGWRTKIPQAVEQLSPRASTIEPAHHSYRVRAVQWKVSHDATKAQRSQIYKIRKKH